MSYLKQSTYFMRRFMLPILITCGFVLNMFSFFVMKRIRGSSTAKYMSFLGLVDSGVLLLGGVNLWLHSVNYNSLPMASVIGCKLVPFMFYSLADYSVMIIVIMTCERFYAVWRPLQANQSNKKRMFRFNLTVSALLCMLVNSHFVFTHNLVEQIDEQDQMVRNNYNNNNDHTVKSNSNKSSFIYIENNNDSFGIVNYNKQQFNQNKICVYVAWIEFYENFWIYIDASIYSFIPFILITLFNVLIISLLNKADAKSVGLREQKILNESDRLNYSLRGRKKSNQVPYQVELSNFEAGESSFKDSKVNIFQV